MEEKRCIPCHQPIYEEHPPCPKKCMQQSCKTYRNKVPIDFKKCPIIWVLGGPGSGKGTQCTKIKAKYGFTHLSTGDLLREQITCNTVRAKCLRDIMERGALVPNKMVLDLLSDAIRDVKNPKGFLIDGYPREKTQGPAFEKEIGTVSVILYFETTDETLVRRCMQRGIETGRTDDTEEAIQNRLQVFHENIAMVLELYTDKVRSIDAERGIEDVFTDVKSILDPLMNEIETKKLADQVAAAAAIIEAQNPSTFPPVTL